MQIIEFDSAIADQWYRSDFGCRLLSYECLQLANFLPKYPTYSCVQIGGELTLQHAKNSTAKNHFYFSVSANQASAGQDVAALVNLYDFPLLPLSLDMLMLVHVLEYCRYPTLLLKQVYESLAEGGKLIIIGFNPWGWWGIKSALKSKQGYPWQGRFWMRSAILRWLNEAGFNTLVSKTFCFKPPAAKEQGLKTNSFIEVFGQLCCPAWGGIYLIIAEKTVHVPLLQRALNWRKSALMSTRMVEPTTRG